MVRNVPRWPLPAGAVLAALGCGVLLLGSAALAEVPTLNVIGSQATLGGQAVISLELVGDAAAAAVAADVDLRFPTTELAFEAPVSGRCQLAQRLAATHRLGGQVLEPGLFSLAIFARDLAIRPLGDGALATCTLDVRADALQAIAPLTLEFAGLGDADGMDLPLRSVTGAIVITDLPEGFCAGDCSGDAAVTIDEIIRGVSIALGQSTVASCRQIDTDGDTEVSIAEIIAAVNGALFGC